MKSRKDLKSPFLARDLKIRPYEFTWLQWSGCPLDDVPPNDVAQKKG